MALTEEGLIGVPGVASRYVRLATGARAHYMTAGDSGPAAILLHGGINGSSGIAGWRFMLPALAAAGFRAYAPDRPGFGISDNREEYWPHQGNFSWSDFVDDFANALCLDEFSITGNSQGASVAAQYAVEHPERIKNIALIASFSLMGPLGLDNDGKVRERFPSKYDTIPWDGKAETMRANMSAIIYDSRVITDDLVNMRTSMANTQLASYMTAAKFNAAIPGNPIYAQRANLLGRFDKLTMPAIYMWGKDDVLAPEEGGYAQEEILTNFKFHYPDQCGHQGQTDRPELFNKVFAEFFATGKVSPELAKEAGASTR